MAKKSRMKFPVQQGKSSFKRVVLENLAEHRKETAEMKQRLAQLVEAAVDKALETKLPVIEGRLALKEANLVKRLLIEKGILTEKEYLERFKAEK